jgi:hypothetical protein
MILLYLLQTDTVAELIHIFNDTTVLSETGTDRELNHLSNNSALFIAKVTDFELKYIYIYIYGIKL